MWPDIVVMVANCLKICLFHKVSYKARWTKINFYTGAAEGKEKWGSNTHLWRAREREPVMGVWGRSPQRGSRGQSPQWVGQGGGRSPPTADEVFVFKTVIFNVSATVLHEMMYCLSCFFLK